MTKDERLHYDFTKKLVQARFDNQPLPTCTCSKCLKDLDLTHRAYHHVSLGYLEFSGAQLICPCKACKNEEKPLQTIKDNGWS